MTRGRHRNTDCVIVRTEAQSGGGTQAETVYMRLPDYLVIGRETQGVFSMNTRKIEPIRKVVEVNYGPPTENGLPFPTSVKGWLIDQAGKRTPAEDVTFTEYRRYTPTPDELDMEKQFGVKPVPPPTPRPPLPPEGQ